MNLFIRPLQNQDALSVAALHLTYLPTRFPNSRSSAEFLSLFYRSLTEVGDIALVAEVKGEIVGFVCIINSLRSIYRQQVQHHFLASITGLLRVIREKPQLIREDFLGR